jgi:hypothetical protein
MQLLRIGIRLQAFTARFMIGETFENVIVIADI